MLGRLLRALAQGLRWAPALDQPLQRAAAKTSRLALRLDGFDPHELAGENDSLRALRFALALDTPLEPGEPGKPPAPFCQDAGPGALLLGLPSCPAAPSLEPAPGPALQGSLDFAALDRAASRLTPFDALHGSVAAGVYGAHLLYGGLLRAAGPLTCVGSPANDVPGAAEVTLRLPLR